MTGEKRFLNASDVSEYMDISIPMAYKIIRRLNDELNGIEERVGFSIKGEPVEIVQSLAKWKRFALKEYKFPELQFR